MKEYFSRGEVLSVVAGRMLTREALDLLSFMSGGHPVELRKFEELCSKCRPQIIAQHPELASSEMQAEIARLENDLSRTTDSHIVIQRWVRRQVAHHGDSLEIRSPR